MWTLLYDILLNSYLTFHLESKFPLLWNFLLQLEFQNLLCLQYCHDHHFSIIVNIHLFQFFT